MSIRINIGCGQTPTNGWKNYDNSWSIRLSKTPLLAKVMGSLGFLSKHQLEFISFAQNNNVSYANATKRIPEKDGSVDAIYSSHMITYLDKENAIKFLQEARRVLKSGGVIRIAVADIKYLVKNYLKDNDADNFIERTHLTKKTPKTIVQKMKYLITGDRNHQWMYDGASLCKLLSSVGFQESRVMEPGITTIIDSGELNLEERVPESVFVEAVNS